MTTREDDPFITMVAGAHTPENLLCKVGTRVPLGRDQLIPGPGTKGSLWGVPGIMRAGLEWEITEPHPVPRDPGPPWAQDLAAKLDEIKALVSAHLGQSKGAA